MNVTEAIARLNELEIKEFAYNHAMGLMMLDGATVAPKKSAAPRGKTMGVLAGEAYKLTNSDEAVYLLDFLDDNRDSLDADTLRRVELRRKSLKELRAVPMETYVRYTELMNDADAAWHEAKEKSDYTVFEPYLRQVIDYAKLFAEKVAPSTAPYDYCLDKYEEGLTMEKAEAFFTALRQRIVPLLAKVAAAEEPDRACAEIIVPAEKQRRLSAYLMERIGLPKDRCAIGETEHPFTIGFSSDDLRITTHYHENDFLAAAYSTIHEGGHALYELGVDSKYNYTCLTGGVTMGIHESQSRFFENLVGRSLGFIESIYPELARLIPELNKYTPRDLFRAANAAKPSLIRTEADELTYPLHIMVRYEMEKRMINGDVNTAELPEMWNSYYKEYLGLDVPDDKRGILQDSHWSGAGIGYFPSYALGSAYGAQMLSKMRETVDFEKAVRGDLAPVREWLRERIWRFGCAKAPEAILRGAFEGEFSPEFYLKHLENRVKEVYGI